MHDVFNGSTDSRNLSKVVRAPAQRDNDVGGRGIWWAWDVNATTA